MNVTVPDGAPPPGAVMATVAVSVTDWPKTLGLAELATAVVVEALLTVSNSAADVLVAKLPSPE